MVRPRLTLPSVRIAAAGVLAAAATLAVATAPAHAAGTATITQSGPTISIDASAASGTIYLGYSTTSFSVPTVTFRGVQFTSWPTDCAEEISSFNSEQSIHCAASSVDTLNVTFGGGNDTLYMDGACYPMINVIFGDGGNTMQGDSNCPTVINSTSGSGDDDIHFAGNGGVAATGAGNDAIRGAGGGMEVHAGPGNDKMEGSGGNDKLYGEDGNDSLWGNGGNDVQDGGPGDDAIGHYSYDDQGADDAIGGAGFDTLDLRGHTGGGLVINLDNVANDGLPGEGDNYRSDFEKVVGSEAGDVITGTAAADHLDGHWGNDVINAGAGNDEIYGSSDDDQLFGNDGDDKIYGGPANDKVDGGLGSDLLFGDYDTCCTNNGSDTINSADGLVDQVSCGGGPDIVTADTVDVVSQDALQLCESVTRTAVAPPPGPTPPPPGPTPPPVASTLTVQAGVAGKPTRSKGVGVAATCNVKCAAAAGVIISKKLAKKYGIKQLLGLATGGTSVGGKFTIKVKIKRKARVRLARAGTIPAKVVLVAEDAGGVQQSRSIKIKLKP